jgi:VanZ family protein
MIFFSKIIFYISLLFLVIISLYPGSLIGYFLYGNLSQQPDIISNPYGTTINHLVCYIYISIIGFFIYNKTKYFRKLLYTLFFLSITLELAHLLIPKRSFQIEDLVANILGVIIAYCVIKIIYYFVKKYEQI